MTYLDNAATTKVDHEVLKKIHDFSKKYYANPSSLHSFGFSVNDQLDESRYKIKELLNAQKSELFFTSGATEANNWVLEHALKAKKKYQDHIMVLNDSHLSILSKAFDIKERGLKLVFCKVGDDGVIDLNHLNELINEKTSMFSFLWINNETGVIQPMDEIIQVVREKNANTMIHVDAVQGIGKLPFVKWLDGIDFMTFSGHKFYAPKGSGGLIVRRNLNIKPYLFGGSQEMNKRAGTENITGIYGMRLALEKCFSTIEKDENKVKLIRDQFENSLKNRVDDVVVFGEKTKRSPYITNIGIRNCLSEVLVHSLEDEGIYISSGSACSSKVKKNSHVLEAMQIDDAWIKNSVRLSYSPSIDFDEIDSLVEKIAEHIGKLRKAMNKGMI